MIFFLVKNVKTGPILKFKNFENENKQFYENKLINAQH